MSLFDSSYRPLQRHRTSPVTSGNGRVGAVSLSLGQQQTDASLNENIDSYENNCGKSRVGCGIGAYLIHDRRGGVFDGRFLFGEF